MQRHKVKAVWSDGAGQSWDILEGETISDAWYLSEGEWRELSPFFSRDELKCKGTGKLTVYVPALEAYNALRSGGYLTAHTPNSAFRSSSHNKAVGGGKRSRHLAGAAFDIPKSAIPSVSEMIEKAKALGFNGFGHYNSFIHIDFRARGAVWKA